MVCHISLHGFARWLDLDEVLASVFKILQLVVARHLRQVTYHTGGQHILHLIHHLVGIELA